MSIGILGATFETPNLGVSALASGAIRCLHQRYPGARIFFLDYEPAVTRKVIEDGKPLEVPLVNMRFSKRFWLRSNIVVLLLSAFISRLLPFHSVRSLLTKNNPTFRAVSEAELFVAVSGGDSFADLYGMPRFLYVALPQMLVLLLGKPLVQLPQTYGPFRGVLARFIARQIVGRSQRVFCRDRVSLDALMGPPQTAEQRGRRGFCYDMAFGIDSVRPEKIEIAGFELPAERDPNLAGVNVSGLLYREAGAGMSSFGIRSDYRETMKAIAEILITQENARVLLVPHVYSETHGSECDQQACEKIYAELAPKYPGRIGMVLGKYGPNEIRYIIGHCGFFTGSRMHACIAAWSQSIPAVAIAYSNKFRGILETISVPSLEADARKLSGEEIAATIREAFRSRAQLAQQLQAIMPGVRSTVHQLLFTKNRQAEKAAATVAPAEPVSAR